MEINPNDYAMARGVRAAYAVGEEDEAMEPRVLVDKDEKPVGRILPGEPVIFYDIRGEREIELTQCFVDPDFKEFPVAEGVSEFATMIQYSPDLPVKVAFPPEEHLEDTLSATLGKAGLKHLKVAESEKAVHLFYFLNGKSQDEEPGEERVVIPSLKDVSNYDEAPEMSAKGISDVIISSCYGQKHDLVIANFANVDVVGHIENEKAVLKAVETVDQFLGEVTDVARQEGFWTIVTADHGTVEEWLYPEGAINTGHTANPVPFIVVPPDGKECPSVRSEGALTDVAPTVLDLLKVKKPEAMTGESLLVDHKPCEGRVRVVLLVLDGWGHRDQVEGNLIAQANTPNFDRLVEQYEHTFIKASGEAVGMPEKAVGNSESGHLHLGAGRRVYSDRLRIDRALQSGEFYENDAFLYAMNKAKKENKPLHLLGIVSFYSSHGTIRHLIALLEMAKREGVPEVFVHSLLGRRGERPESGAYYIAEVEEKCKELGVGQVVSVMGRFWALDREHYWDRVEKAYRCLAFGDAVKVSE